MSFGMFLLGAILMVLGFFMVYRSRVFDEAFGDFGLALGFYDAKWLSWKTLGLFLMLVGFLIAFNLFNLFLVVTFGSFFQRPGGV
jgi:hypothetical protein